MGAGLTSDFTPHTPPTTDQDSADRLRLIRSRRVGPATYRRLIAEYGSAGAALEALPGLAQAAGVQGYEPCPAGVALNEIRAAHAVGAEMICLGDPRYPELLAQIPDAPALFWARGDLSLLARPMLAVVGARNASSLGLRIARRLGESLSSAGYTIVSGLARGVDAAAHEAALNHQGRTVAVLAGGADVVYPAENAVIAARILAEGCIISEQPPGLEPQARHFPIRNRIISGLSQALIVAEAAARSGSLLTARDAAEQGREVFAVPGHPFDARAAGCNQLIREGAALIRSAADVIEALGGPQPQASVPREHLAMPAPARLAADTGTEAGRAERPLARPPAARKRESGGGLRRIASLHRMILDRLSPSPMAEDQLIRDLGLPAAQLAPEILLLEIEGRLNRQPGGLISRA